MSDIKEIFLLARYEDGSWSIEGDKEGFGYLNLTDLIRDQFKDEVHQE